MGLSSIASMLGRNIGRVVSKGASAAKAAKSSGIVSRAADWAKSNPDTILSGVQMVQGALQQRGAQQLEGDALARAQSLFAERAPLRRLALERLQRPRTVRRAADVFADPSNPYG